MIEDIKKYCEGLILSFDTIPENRKLILENISKYIHSKSVKGEPIHLVYICTHNSRRSHLGQIWAHVASNFYGIKNVHTYSGGTEATAFNINAINALKRVGFIINAMNDKPNTLYHVFHDVNELPSICFSKKYDDEINPKSNFAAIMTCSDADENCPFIPGVELRMGTTYEDPKAFDHTAQQDAKYDERCKQIALETLYVFSKVFNK